MIVMPVAFLFFYCIIMFFNNLHSQIRIIELMYMWFFVPSFLILQNAFELATFFWFWVIPFP